MLGAHLISWCAKKQPTVSRSSTEAEYRALASIAAETTWISSVLRDLHIYQNKPAELLCDNLSAVHLSANPKFHSRSKHIDTDYHFIREKVALGLIETCHISNVHQIADIFTKSLPRTSFVALRSKLGVCVPPNISLRGDESITPVSEIDFEEQSSQGTLVVMDRENSSPGKSDNEGPKEESYQSPNTSPNKASWSSSKEGRREQTKAREEVQFAGVVNTIRNCRDQTLVKSNMSCPAVCG